MTEMSTTGRHHTIPKKGMVKKMKKRYLISLIPLVISAGCMIFYKAIGSSVAEDGSLVEPFFLIPIAWLFFIAGIVAGIILGIMGIVRKNQAKKRA